MKLKISLTKTKTQIPNNFRYSKLALKTQFGSSGKTDNKVVYKVGSRITVTQGGSGKKIGYFHWAEYVEIKNDAASTTSWQHVSSNCAMDMTSRETVEKNFVGIHGK